MQQAFKYFTIQAGGTPQPLIGTVLSTAVTAPQAAATHPRNYIDNKITLTVADSSMFVGAQYLSITDPSTFATESKLRVFGVPDSTHVVVTGIQNAHPGGAFGTGAFVYLGDLASVVRVQAKDGNAGDLSIGDSPQLVKATGVHVFYVLSAAATGQEGTVEFTLRGASNTEVLSQYWIDGTTGDSYLPSLGIV